MYATKIKLREFRSFHDVEVKLGKHLTCISGQNGVGKSQILALIGNSGYIPKRIGETLQGYQFRADWSEIVKGDPNHDQLTTVKQAITIDYDALPKASDLNQEIYPNLNFVNSLGFRTYWQNKKVSVEQALSWKEQNTSVIARNHIDDLARKSVTRYFKTIAAENFNLKQKEVIAQIDKLIQQKATLEDISEVLNKQSSFDIENIEISIPDRLRITPEKQKGTREVEGKLLWPTYYLGLSRLYPSGEADSPEIKEISLSEEDKSYLQNAYNSIFSVAEDKFELSSVHLSESPRKHGIGVENNEFGPLGNSNGQDNLNQILAAMLSFKKLNKSLGSNYIGGALLIDELDASLHPAAQNKLLDFMSQETRKYNYQIIFTTHSLSMIEHFSQMKQLKTKNDPDFMLAYLTNGRGRVESKENPSMSWIHNELLVSYNHRNVSEPIPVITEDDASTTFLTHVLAQWDLNMHLDFLSLSSGWTNLITLISKDFNYFGKWITIFDADVPEESAQRKLKNSLFNFKKIESEKEVTIQSILKLPNLLPEDTDSINDSAGSASKDCTPYIELELWLFLESLPADDPFYSNPQLQALPYFRRNLTEEGPFSDKYQKGNEESRVKAWYKDNQPIINIAWPYFIKDKENIIKPFVKLLIAKYNVIVNKYYSDLDRIQITDLDL